MGETQAPCSRLGLYNLFTEDNPALTDIDRMITPLRYAAYWQSCEQASRSSQFNTETAAIDGTFQKQTMNTSTS
jgi:hypothetical protein